MIRKILFLGLFISGVILYAFRGNGKFDNWWGSGVRGSGVERTESRSVSKFKGIEVGGAFDVDVVAGTGETKVELSGDDNLIEYVETEVQGGILSIRTKKSISPKLTLRVRITTPDLASLRSSGASDVVLNGINNERFTLETSGAGSVKASVQTNDLRIETSGAGDVRIGGSTKTLSLETSGAADIDAHELKAAKVRVEVSGAGDVSVFASDELDVHVSGAGDVKYSGNPKIINQDVSGAGSLRKRN
jgi:hypothetical protein